MLSERQAYEAEVRALATWGAGEVAAGRSVESVAREAVERRNGLKLRYRANAPPAIIARLELRNLVKYGHPVGPDADAFFRKYGSWEEVLAAASRPASLASG